MPQLKADLHIVACGEPVAHGYTYQGLLQEHQYILIRRSLLKCLHLQMQEMSQGSSAYNSLDNTVSWRSSIDYFQACSTLRTRMNATDVAQYAADCVVGMLCLSRMRRDVPSRSEGVLRSVSLSYRTAV